jgi:tetraacyldisaccharide 4'-kinase
MNARPMGDTLAGRLLGRVFFAAVRARNAMYDRGMLPTGRAGIPVVSVGGVHAGGTGKTPLVMMIAEYLCGRGVQVGLASRGYGRPHRAPVLRAPGEECLASEVGDEPAMMRQRVPSMWLSINPDRLAAARALAASMDASRRRVALLDDALQHRRLARDIDIVCLPPSPWASLPIPAGYLREPLSSIRRADMVCMIGAQDQVAQMLADAQRARSELRAKRVAVLKTVAGPWVNARTGAASDRLPLQRPSLLCAIARPERFVDAAALLGVSPQATRCLPDHHQFTEDELRRACEGGSDGLVTTEKDVPRIMSLPLANQCTIWYLRLGLGFAEPEGEESFHSMFNGL